MLAEAGDITAAAKPPQRVARRDLQLWRIILALCCAPAAGILLIAVPLSIYLIATADSVGLRLSLYIAGIGYLGALPWSLVLGLAYLGLVVGRRGWIGRWECLHIGALSGATFFMAISLIIDVMELLSGHTPTLEDVLEGQLAGFVYGLCLIPSGFMAGWVCWRILAWERIPSDTTSPA